MRTCTAMSRQSSCTTSLDVRVSAIVLAHGKEELLRECLRSLDLALARVEGESELIVVLNQVSLSMRDELAASGRHTLVEPGRNLGFAAGVPAGIARSRGEWIALFNDDCVAEPAAVSELLAAAASRPEVGSVAAKVLFTGERDTINSAGIEIDELGIAYERLLGAPAAEGGTEVSYVFGASGAACLYRRAMLDAVGGFDESFFAYLEDADLAWRAQMSGWRCVYAPRAIVRHHHSATLGHRSSEKNFLVGRNRVRMLAKNATRAQLLRRAPAMIAYDLAYVAVSYTHMTLPTICSV